MTREELAQLKDMERSLIEQWSDVLRLIGDERNDLGTDDHKLVSALCMAVGFTRRSSECFTREAIGAVRTPDASQTGPDETLRQ